MRSRRSLRQLLVAVLLGVMVGGGLMAVTPAGAEVSQSLATSWKKIWKKELKPLADKRYYKKSQSDAKYASKAEAAAAAAAAQSAATSAANSATDGKLGSYYKKSESDAKYVAKPTLITGGYYQAGYSEGGTALTYVVDFGANLATPPVVHYIESGATPPAECPGTVSAPDAAPGHLCVYETGSGGVANGSIINFAGSNGEAESTGATIFALTTGATPVDRWMRGRWAVRPAANGFNGQGRIDPGAPGLGAAGVGGAR